MVNHQLKKENLKIYTVISPDGTKRTWRRSALIYYCKEIYGITFKDFLRTYKGIYKGYKLIQDKAQNLIQQVASASSEPTNV